MIIEFTVSNFRSIKNEQIFSMLAYASKTKGDNVSQIILKNGSSVRLLNSAVLYGANASGKSNFIRGFRAMNYFILSSTDFKNGEDIICYEPFELDNSKITAPTRFKVIFIGTDNIKYQYEIEYNRKEVLKEILIHFPLGQPAVIFNRTGTTIKLKDGFRDKRGVSLRIIPNQLFLSKIGNDGHEQMGEIYLYFKNIEVWNVPNRPIMNALAERMKKDMSLPENEKFKKRLIKLINIADTQIEDIETHSQSNDFSDVKLDDKFPSEVRDHIINSLKERIELRPSHGLYEGDVRIGTKTLEWDEESLGTQVLFALGGLILRCLEKGGTIFFDELDNSLHPRLCRFLVRLFHNPLSNPNHAQLIFATHEVTLLDKDIFRKDQIWFAKKNKRGDTEIYSAQDFEGVRDDTPFDKWYMAGKFDAQPQIKEVEFIYGDA